MDTQINDSGMIGYLQPDGSVVAVPVFIDAGLYAIGNYLVENCPTGDSAKTLISQGSIERLSSLDNVYYKYMEENALWNDVRPTMFGAECDFWTIFDDTPEYKYAYLFKDGGWFLRAKSRKNMPELRLKKEYFTSSLTLDGMYATVMENSKEDRIAVLEKRVESLENIVRAIKA